MLLRYWHTLRYLRPVQIYGRLWFHFYKPRPDLKPAPGLRPVPGQWMAPVARPVSMLGSATFRFLNDTHEAAGPVAWNDPARDKLWLYNLHYFDDLNAADAPARHDWHWALFQRWVAENPPGKGNGWEPYPTSLRLVNWIKWVLAGHTLPPEGRYSLAIQARWLRRQLEYHLLGNHLFANAKALVFAGTFFAGPEAEQWRILGQRLLARELREQILPDGGHFERSPMYHAILLEDVLDLLNLASTYYYTLAPDLVAVCRAKAAAMLRWLAIMCYPDGEISFFNDAAMGIAPTLGELVAYGQRLGLSAATSTAKYGPVVSESLSSLVLGSGIPAGTTEAVVRMVWRRESGYVRLEAGPAVTLLDVAPIGPDYLPGHAHADTLSFELSLFGQRVIVNSGTSCYGTGPERQRQRGTAAHTTVTVDGQNSSEVWGGFRVARRARPLNLRWGEAADGGWVECAHDGYRRLPGRVTHRRRWTLSPTSLRLEDRLDGRYQEAVARLHFHPTVRAGLDSALKGWLELPGGQCLCWNIESGCARLIPSTWHPRFGVSEANICLEILFNGPVVNLLIQW